jgi:hypothetical protein
MGLDVYAIKSKIEQSATDQCGSVCVTVTVVATPTECLQSYTSSPAVRLKDPNDQTSDYVISRGTTINLQGGAPESEACPGSGGSSAPPPAGASAPPGTSQSSDSPAP